MGKVSLGLVCLAHSIPWIQLYDFRGPLCPKTILLQLYWVMLKCACPVKAELTMKSLHSCVCMMSQLEALVLVMLTPVGDFL